MSQVRNAPLTARSVLLSTLLGLDPPSLPASALVRTAALFGISEGTARVAMSRMVATGELAVVDGRHTLVGRMLDRQARQTESRQALIRAWHGDWITAVVVADGGRAAADRAELRDGLARARLAELREGVWLRPANLDVVFEAAELTWMTSRVDDAVALAAQLWDLHGWAATARSLLADMRRSRSRLDRGHAAELAPAFVLAASVLRHLQADPLLPDALLPRRWPGAQLRSAYEAYEAAFQSRLRSRLRADSSNSSST
jgi:phenylacetic acid degradation operon negative regulatory protein